MEISSKSPFLKLQEVGRPISSDEAIGGCIHVGAEREKSQPGDLQPVLVLVHPK